MDVSRCQRPACDRSAVGRVGFDMTAQVVVIDGFIEAAGAVARLCAVHLDRLQAPKGWVIDDLRPGQRSLFRRDLGLAADIASTPIAAGGADPSATVTKIDDRRRFSARRAAEPTLPLEPENDPDGPAAEPHIALLDAHTPLLARAFAQPRDRAIGEGVEALLGTRAG